MLLGLTACGKQAGIEKSDASYVASFYDIPDIVTGISRLLIKDNAAYMCVLGGKRRLLSGINDG